MRSLNQISLKPADREAVCRAAALLKERFPVTRVVLFGSKARGSDAPESDIDLLVLTRQPLDQNAKAQIVDSLFDLQLELGVVLSTLVVGEDDWDRGYFQVLPIHGEIEREGVMT